MQSHAILSDHIAEHCHQAINNARAAEHHPLWLRSCPELTDIDFIRLGLLLCISTVDSGRQYLLSLRPQHAQTQAFSHALDADSR